MAAPKFSIFLLVFGMASCSNAGESSAVDISNKLSACVSINAPQQFIVENMAALRFKSEVKQPISECGCKSALSTFSVEADNGEYRSLLLQGKISFLKSEEKVLPLAAEASLIGQRKIRISFSCAQPD